MVAFHGRADTSYRAPHIPQRACGPLCDANIPIFSENQLAALIARFEIDLAFLASLAQGASPFFAARPVALAGLPGLLCFRPGSLEFPGGEERPIVAPVVRSPPAEEFL